MQNSSYAIVTGANVGIGYHTALHLAKLGMRVTLACRNQQKGECALEQIMTAVPRATVELSIVDLSSLESVRQFAHRTRNNTERIDLLVNNAAVMAIPTRMLSPDGNEMQFATNHLGHFALTGELFGLLSNSSTSRVVSVSSLAHRYGKLDFNDLQKERNYEGWEAYGATKLANLLFAFELDRRCRRRNIPIVSVACHPGVSKTNILSSGPVMGKKVARTYISEMFAQQFAQSDSEGAKPVIHAGTSATVKGGEYYGPDGLFEVRGKPKLVSPIKKAYDLELALKLWDASCELAGVDFNNI